jgi:formamidopyrimidine-DNA glycosylase
MPELPEVETVVRTFRPKLTGRRISSFEASWPNQIQPSIPKVKAAICGQTIMAVRRRAKYILLDLKDGSALILHLKMSGRFEWEADHALGPSHVRARIGLGRGDALLFVDARKFGRIRHSHDAAAALAHLGPEPLQDGFTPAALFRILNGRRRQLKPLLLDQTLIAGLGNIYTDEALHRAKLHPELRSNEITRAEAGRLQRAIRFVLNKGIRYNGTTLDWIYPGGQMQNYLKIYGRKGEACPRCKKPIQRIVVAQRSTHLCPACQPATNAE